MTNLVGRVANSSERPCPAAGSSAAQEGVLGDWELVAPRRRWRPDAEVELLSQVLPGPGLRSHVPHAHVVKGHVDCSPCIGVYLTETHTSNDHRELSEQMEHNSTFLTVERFQKNHT